MTDFSVQGATVVVVGAARSGIAAARLLAARGGQVVLTEQQREVDTSVSSLREDGIELELGGHDPHTLTSAELVVLSPGVSPTLPVFDAVRRRGVPVISEIELASRWLRGRLVAVTGTKGKSTTVVLLGRMLEASGCAVLVGGNVGTALSSQVERSTPDVIHVVEVSSFQLELTTTFKPSIAVLLNLHSDHLDRHGGYESYAAAKARIFANQTEGDTLVINGDDPEVVRLTGSSRALRCSYALNERVDDGVTVVDEVITYRRPGGDLPLVPVSAVHLLGRHFLSDVLAATTVAHRIGVSGMDMTRAVGQFTGLEHALEPVGEIRGVRFINDSKATNIVAARRAIESCGIPLVVIMGGRFKGGDLASLAPLLEERVDAVVAIGEARDRIYDTLASSVRVIRVESLGAAVSASFGLATPGGTVLLAPACASLDMFRNYAERGQVFTQAVSRLREGAEEKREQ